VETLFKKKNEGVERYLSSLIGLLKNTREVIACYQAGSYPFGYYVEGVSDIDITVIFDTENFEKQIKTIEEYAKTFVQESDLKFISKREIIENPGSNKVRELIWPMKIANTLIYGTDILEEFNLPDQQVFAQITAQNTVDHMNEIRDLCLLYNNPTQYPDIEDNLKRYITLRNGEPSIKQLVNTATWIASTYLARDYGVYTACKNVCVIEYRKRYEDGEMMFAILDDFKNKWGYKLPRTSEDIVQLGEYCKYVRDKALQLIKDFRILDAEEIMM